MTIAKHRISNHSRIMIVLCFFMQPLFTSGQGFLKTSGKNIVNGQGQSIILRGMGLGGWMLQEGYMFQLSFAGQQYRIKEKIAEVVGVEKTAQFYEQWLLRHTTKKDIDLMASWGFNSIRLPMHYNLYTLPAEEEPVAGQHTWIEKGFAMTDSLLSWCAANKLYLILDLHAAPGGQGNDLAISDRDPSKKSLWESEANQQKTIALWRKLAARYANEPWIGGYDIINEPNWGFEDAKDFRGTAERKNIPLKKLMVDITKAIREVDSKHIIIIEGNGFGNNYHGILPTWDDNMVLSFHKYGNFNTTDAIRSFLDLREKYNVPLWLGESGENSNTWFTEAINLVEKKGIGWAWWQQKKMGINNPQEIKQPEGYDKLLAYWSGKGAKPSADEAWKTLQQWLHNIEATNTVFHPDVIDAMFRQVNTDAAIPFKAHILSDKILIQAVDFDMGRQGAAYYDKDTASYHYTPGVNTVGNKGRSYRNDGVDIREQEGSNDVFSIEDGEWLQYTVTVKKKGVYRLSFTTAADKNKGRVSFSSGKNVLVNELPLTGDTEKKTWQTTTVEGIRLKKGTQQFRVYAREGGFNFRSFQLTKQ